ncbi:MAG TPA: hypothetical protein VGM88_14960 [Kofleriaceae bacterium]|jgi:hypothetical protein
MRTALLIGLLAACDGHATASEPGAGRAEQKSKEYETCGASAACADELRCFEHECRRTARSTLGDYLAAAGALAKSKGDLDGAIAQYAAAVARYETEKLALPPDVDCAYGTVLAAGKAKKETAELAARVLHRCVMAVPVGSHFRTQALADLATLADAGLDPTLIASPKAADLYLTKGPAKPATDKLAVTITPAPAPTGKSYQLIPDKLAEPANHDALVACWTAYNQATQKDTLTVNVAVKAAYIPSEYEDEQGLFVVKVDPAAAGAPAEETCVHGVVEPAIKGLKLTDAFATKLAITVK